MDCYSCQDLNAKTREIRRLHSVCRGKDNVMKNLVEAGKTALELMEQLGYVNGEQGYDDLKTAIQAGELTLG